MGGTSTRLRAGGLRAGRRLVGRQVETAVWTLRHPATGRTVTLVGTMHIGEARYFDELSRLLARLAANGAEVHLEGIAHRDDEPLSARERIILSEARSARERGKAGAAVSLLRVESQGRMQLPEGTRNIDLSHAELLRRLGRTAYRRLFAVQPARLPSPVIDVAGRAAIRLQLRHSRGIELLHTLSPRWRRLNHIVIDERNAVAFAGATDVLSGRDVVLVWGADHLPGLARLFAGVGYHPLAGRWLIACAV